ncbi:hypothetical protein HBM95_23385 [Enterobacter asburiae]|nr:hypothetical protein [Enterobacter asburiae]
MVVKNNRCYHRLIMTGLGFILCASAFAEQEIVHAEKAWETTLDTITDRLLPAPDGGIYAIGGLDCRPSEFDSDKKNRCGIHGHTVSKAGQVSQWGAYGSWGLNAAGIVLTGDGRLLFPVIRYTDDNTGYIALYQAYPGNKFQPENIFSSPILSREQLLEFKIGKMNVVYSKDFTRAYLSIPDSSGQVTVVALDLNNKTDNVLWQARLSIPEGFGRHDNLLLSEEEGKLLHHTSGAVAILDTRDGNVIRSDNNQSVAGEITPASLLAMPQGCVFRWNVDENGIGVLDKMTPFSDTIIDAGFPSVSFPANTSDTSIKFWGGLTSDPQKKLFYQMLTQKVVAYNRDTGKVKFEITPEKADFHFFNLGNAGDITFDSATGWGYFAYHNTKIGYGTWEEGVIGFSSKGQRKKIVFPDSGIRHVIGNSLLAEFSLPPLIHDGVMYTFYSDTLSAWPLDTASGEYADTGLAISGTLPEEQGTPLHSHRHITWQVNTPDGTSLDSGALTLPAADPDMLGITAWPLRLAEAINRSGGALKAGEMENGVITPLASSYRNHFWLPEGEKWQGATVRLAFLPSEATDDKWRLNNRDDSALPASLVTGEQSVLPEKMVFELFSKKSGARSPLEVDGLNTKNRFTWAMDVARKVNAQSDVIKLGEVSADGGQTVSPLASQYRNRLWVASDGDVEVTGCTPAVFCQTGN